MLGLFFDFLQKRATLAYNYFYFGIKKKIEQLYEDTSQAAYFVKFNGFDKC